MIQSRTIPLQFPPHILRLEQSFRHQPKVIKISGSFLDLILFSYLPFLISWIAWYILTPFISQPFAEKLHYSSILPSRKFGFYFIQYSIPMLQIKQKLLLRFRFRIIDLKFFECKIKSKLLCSLNLVLNAFIKNSLDLKRVMCQEIQTFGFPGAH